MNGPNKTVARARAAKWMLQQERTFRSYGDAQREAVEWRRLNPGFLVRVTSFKLGPRNDPRIMYAVRSYLR